jgi:alpha-tubulin suppressor-like RCC1 family protein
MEPSLVAAKEGRHGDVAGGEEGGEGSRVGVEDVRGRWALVACGVTHSAAVTCSGLLYVWGNGEHGRLGLGDCDRRLAPTLLHPRMLAHEKVAMASLGGLSLCLSLALSRSLSLSPSLSLSRSLARSLARSLVCVSVAAWCRLTGHISGMEAAHVCGAYTGKHSVAVTERGALFAWGYGEYGRLGLADRRIRLVPTLVSWHLFGEQRVVMAVCGASHTSAVCEGGAIYTWGDAESGQLGHQSR